MRGERAALPSNPFGLKCAGVYYMLCLERDRLSGKRDQTSGLHSMARQKFRFEWNAANPGEYLELEKKVFHSLIAMELAEDNLEQHTSRHGCGRI
jgi:hypothetical protein